MLVVDDIHTYYGDSYVLHGVSLEVRPGQLVALMGRNGVGKSTTIRSIMGLTPPRRGSIQFNGKELTKLPTHDIANSGVGLVPQGRRIFATLTVEEHLTQAMGRRIQHKNWTLDRIFAVFPRLQERLKNKGRNLSGGEQSMLAMARALRMEPRLLLMDEPMEGLSPLYVDIMVDVISRLKAEEAGGMSMLLVVQELPVALELADYIYVMSEGTVVFHGTPDALRERTDVQAKHIGVGS